MNLDLLPPPSARGQEVTDHLHDPESHFKQKLLEFLTTQAKGAAVPVLLSALLVVAVVWGKTPLGITIGWICTVVALIVLRWRFLPRLATSDGSADERIRRAVTLSLLNGIAHGAAAWLFFGFIDQFERTIVTMIMLGWASGSVAVTAGYRPSFLAYSLPSLGPLAVVWALSSRSGDSDRWLEAGVALMIVLFGVLQSRFAQTSQKMFRATFDYEQELARERDRAESASRAKSRFLASASHDLRQPLHTIALFGAALSLRVSDPVARNDVRHLNAAIESLNALLNALLDLSKLDAGVVRPNVGPVDVSALVTRAVESFRPIAEHKGLYLQLHARRGVQCNTDAQLFERIVNNLIDNAIKYTVQGGVRVEVQGGESVEVVVADTGVGIPASESERVFEEFYQLGNPERDRSKGLGLGLAVVQRTADLLGVELSLQSEVGAGTTFRVCMPRGWIALAAKPERTARARLTRHEPKRLRVLVLDDESAVRHGMASLLAAWGWQPVLASTTSEALHELSSQPVDVVVADFRLRASETGLDAIRRIRSEVGDLPIVLITGETSPERLREAIASELPLLHKPIDPSALRHALENVVGAAPDMSASHK